MQVREKVEKSLRRVRGSTSISGSRGSTSRLAKLPPPLPLQLQLHYITLHYTNYTTLRHTTLHSTSLHYTNYTTPHYTTPRPTTPHHTTLPTATTTTRLRYTTLHYTHYITLHSLHYHKCNCNYTTVITLLTPQLPLHYTTTTTTAALHHTTSSSCGWGDRPGDHCNHCNHSKKHNSDHLSVHQWIRSAIRDSQQPTSPIGFLFLKLPPPPCAVLLV